MTGLVAAGEGAAHRGELRPLLAELFHALSQPLTSLRCGLAVSLQAPRTRQEYQRHLEMALEQAESVSRLTEAIRELVEAGNYQGRHVVSLGQYLQEAAADLQPVAESAGVIMSLHSQALCPVDFSADRLRQALHYLLGYILNHSAPAAEVSIAAQEDGGFAEVTVHGSQWAEPAPDLTSEGRQLRRRLGLALARRIFERSGGHLDVQQTGPGFCFQLRLPLV